MNKYITLISSKEYFLSGLVLNQSLKDVNSKYPLIIALIEKLNCEPFTSILKDEGIDYIIIPELSYVSTSEFQQFIGTKTTLMNTASKIALFDLDWEDKLIYLDSDIYVRKNIDELFNYPNGAMLRMEGEENGASGLFVFIPKYHCYSLYKTILDTIPGALDGFIIGEMFFSAKENPDFQIPSYYMSQNFMLEDDCHLLHYAGEKKPFLLSPQELQQHLFFPAYQMYCKTYLPLRIKYKNIFDF